MFKKLNTIILALVLTVSMGASAFAETGGASNTGANQGYNNMYRTTAADNDTDWGWIGLLGLAGLAGLMGRNRNREMQR